MLPTLQEVKSLSDLLAPTKSTRTYDAWYSALPPEIANRHQNVLADLWWRTDIANFLKRTDAAITLKSRAHWEPLNYKVANLLRPKITRAAQVTQVFHTLGCLPIRGLIMPTQPQSKPAFTPRIYDIPDHLEIPEYLMDTVAPKLAITLPSHAIEVSFNIITAPSTLSTYTTPKHHEPHFLATFETPLYRYAGYVYPSHLPLKAESMLCAASDPDFPRVYWMNPLEHLRGAITTREIVSAMLRATAESINSGIHKEAL